MLTCSGEVDSATAAQLPFATLDGLHDPNSVGFQNSGLGR